MSVLVFAAGFVVPGLAAGGSQRRLQLEAFHRNLLLVAPAQWLATTAILRLALRPFFELLSTPGRQRR